MKRRLTTSVLLLLAASAGIFLYVRRGSAPLYVLVGAGDIADCKDLSGAEATAELLDHIPGTVMTVGDLAYPDGSKENFQCYDKTWGRTRSRTRPAPGNHEFHAAGATPYFDYFGPAAGDPKTGYYSYELASWHIIVLNSECIGIGPVEGIPEGLHGQVVAVRTARAEKRLVPIGKRASHRMSREIGAEPFLLRRASFAPADVFVSSSTATITTMSASRLKIQTGCLIPLAASANSLSAPVGKTIALSAPQNPTARSATPRLSESSNLR